MIINKYSPGSRIFFLHFITKKFRDDILYYRRTIFNIKLTNNIIMLTPIIQKIKKKQKEYFVFIRYAIVGISGTIIDFLTFVLLRHNFSFFQDHILLANSCGFILAVINNFWWNKIWTFEDKSNNYKKQFSKFLIVSLAGLALSNFFIFLFVKILKINPELSKIITSGIVMFWNFLANKLWTFRKEKKYSFKIEEENNFTFELSIIIPAYNEEKRLPQTLASIDKFLRKEKINAELIVVSDGSSDGTEEVVQKLKNEVSNLNLISYKQNQGKGYAVKMGVVSARGKLILFLDADNSTPIEEFLKLKNKIKNYDIVIGSRKTENSDVKIAQPLYRVLLGRFGNFLIRIFLIDNISDTQCGFKLFRHNVAQEIFARQTIYGWGFDMEILAIAKLFNLSIAEVGVSWINSTQSRFRPIKDAYKTFLELIKIKMNLWMGRY